MKHLAIITARGGSKRIPRKNIKDFLGKPMIAYAIDAALKSALFDEVMVSTDDKEIAEIAIKYGAKIPFMRSAKTSDDFATTFDVLEEVIDEYSARNIYFENLTCIYPCAPFLTKDILNKAYKTFKESNADSLIPVARFSFPIQRAFKVNQHGYLEFNEPQYAITRSQDLEPMFHDVGMFYFFKTKELLQNKSLVSKNSLPFELDESYVQDIDNDTDWQMAEIKYRIIYGA